MVASPLSLDDVPSAPLEGEDDARGAQVIRQVSGVGLALGIFGVVVLLLWSHFGTANPGSRTDQTLVAFAMTIVLFFWAGAFFWSGRGHIQKGALLNSFGNMLGCGLLAMVQGGEVLATITAVIALSVNAMVVSRGWLVLYCAATATVLTGVLGATDLGWLRSVSVPIPVLRAATIAAIMFGLPSLMGTLQVYQRRLRASRKRATLAADRLRYANDQLADRARVLEEVSGKLERRNAEMRDFLYIVSHDLRAPLINLDGFSVTLAEAIEDYEEKLRSEPDDAHTAWPEIRSDMDESIHFLRQSTGKMEAMVNGLLELSRIENRPQEASPLELTPLVTSITDSLRHQIDEADIDIQIGQLPRITGDSLRVNQVFSNLIGNAIKYMGDETPKKIEIRCRDAGRLFEFSVRDTGIGLRPQDCERIFRPFTQIDPRRAPGEGLGLTIVRKIVARAGGDVWLESEVGSGSTFYFTWPKPGAQNTTTSVESSSALHTDETEPSA